ncbi:MAG TPA: squalene/phytoene synthase family protein [Anaerolineales bacterium]|jgi:phytoene/squalene synthetase|nr:squalene/phytoene synthase family protein [Anaerolineales bacterium]
MITSPAASITKAASKQTYYTIRFLADQARRDDAYRAYAYFRWLDDVLDADSGSVSERRSFLNRQISLLERSYWGETLRDVNPQEKMLVELVQHDTEKNSGLQSYLRNMMQVLDFDVSRRGMLVSQDQLNEYTRWLAISVTEAMHYFIGHDQLSPQNSSRYLAVTGAHIAHLLRDTWEDVQTGYYNIPREYLAAKGIGPQDIESEAYRAWVQERANLARACFKSGKQYLAQVENMRCRIAGYAYIARFEGVLQTIERLDYRLAPASTQYKGLREGIRMSGSTLLLAFFPLIRKLSSPG